MEVEEEVVVPREAEAEVKAVAGSLGEGHSEAAPPTARGRRRKAGRRERATRLAG